jgi:hypothetical protein
MCQGCCTYCRANIRTNKSIPVDLGSLPVSIRDNIPLPGVSGVTLNQLGSLPFCISGQCSNFFEKNNNCNLNCESSCLDKGKKVVQTVIESFGGIYFAEFSSKTRMLVVGDNKPGAMKLTKARANGAVIVSAEVLCSKFHRQLQYLI